LLIMKISEQQLYSALKKYFGFDEFRSSQKDIIIDVLNNKNVLTVMPTGGGKSLCYQLPSIFFEGTTIVISPLIALMKDQVDKLQQNNFPAEFINSSISFSKINERLQEAAQGKYKLLYIAPERLSSKEFRNLLKNINLSFLAIDEAHCISEWGHDFRPAYRTIVESFDDFKNVSTIALTATATPEVQDDIIKSLELKDTKRYVTGFNRENLSYFTVETSDKIKRLSEILKIEKSGSNIMYCGTRRRVERFAEALKKEKIDAIPYHAGFPEKYRKFAQEEFLTGKVRNIVATNAFGMGIDKPDVRNVIHLDLVQTLESYYQEAGRAGRDGKPSRCTLIFTQADRDLQEFFIETTYPPLSDIKEVYETIFDINNIAIGKKPQQPVLYSEYQIANLAGVSSYSVRAIFNFFERNKILHSGQGNGSAKIHFTATKERIKEYFQNIDENRRNVLEALLRHISSEAFDHEIEFSLKSFLKKYMIREMDLRQAVESFEYARIMNFELPGVSNGIILSQKRMQFSKLDIDFDRFYERKKRAYVKLDKVIEYATTSECKRNFILEYFHDFSMTGPCGRCTSCLSMETKPSERNARNDYLQTNIIIAVAQLEGYCGTTSLINFLAGKNTSKINELGVAGQGVFASCKDYTEIEIIAEVENAIFDGLIGRTKDIVTTFYPTDKGIKKIGIKPKQLEIKSNSNIDKKETNELYQKLKELREELASIKQIQPRSITTDKALRLIADKMPLTIRDLLTVKGIGKQFAAKYGEQIIKKVAEFKNNGIDESPQNTKNELTIADKVIKMIEDGKDIADISSSLSISNGAVAKAIQEAIESGVKLDRSSFFLKSEYAKVYKTVKRNPRATLSDIRATSNVDMEYYLLRVAVAFARKDMGF
jgi:ATP-dependent DNA helicase RecQ